MTSRRNRRRRHSKRPCRSDEEIHCLAKRWVATVTVAMVIVSTTTVTGRGGGGGGGASSGSQDDSSPVIILPGWEESSNPEERMFQALSEVISSCETASRLLQR